MTDEETEEIKKSDDVFTLYPFKEVISGCKPHPGNIVESGCLASISAPALTYSIQGSIPDEVIQSGKLSALQLESILHACQTHQTILPCGNRRGFYIGDAAGVGKGRQIAGIIADNYARSRTKHIWFSISPDLIVDARRDLVDIGCYIKVIEGCRQLDQETRAFGLSSDFKDGIVFSTYATLVSSVRGVGSSQTTVSTQNISTRLAQLVKWCGGKDYFEGCIVFDECHKAKHFVPKSEKASSKVAVAVMTIQRLLPRARVVYCSATGVSDIRNMAYMERLGLWGDGCPFNSFDHFLSMVENRGLGVAELMAMELKASGVYVSRGLSYQDTEFSCVESRLTADQVKLYDSSTHVWSELRRALNTALQRTKTKTKGLWAQFWAAHQRFFRQLCMGLKVDSVVKVTQEALAVDSGSAYCVVIGLQATGESSLGEEMGFNAKVGQRTTQLVSVCAEILTRFITNFFPVVVQGENLEDVWCVQARQMLFDFVKQLNLPPAPLDDLIDRLGGPDSVAEMTGRRGRLVRDGSGFVYESRTGSSKTDAGGVDGCMAVESVNVSEQKAFMSGRKLVGILSDASSTGISLHSDRRVENTRRRIHITLELAWSADKTVQQLGRSHRSNQVTGPIYKLVTTELGGERRFAAAVAARLESLGALTRGDRRAGFGGNLSAFNVTTIYGRTGLKSMCNAVLRGVVVHGVTELNKIPILGDLLKHNPFTQINNKLRGCLEDMGLLVRVPNTTTSVGGNELTLANDVSVTTFLNRLLGISVKWQQVIFHYFSASVEAATRQARQEGRFNEGLVDLMATSVRLINPPQSVFTDFQTTPLPTQLYSLEIDRGIPWQKALHICNTENSFANEASPKMKHTISTDALNHSDAIPNVIDNSLVNGEHLVNNNDLSISSTSNDAPIDFKSLIDSPEPERIVIDSSSNTPLNSPDKPKKPDTPVNSPETGSNTLIRSAGFYRAKRDLFGNRAVLLALPKQKAAQVIRDTPGQSSDGLVFRIVRPNTGISLIDMPAADLKSKYTPISDQDTAKRLWNEAFDRYHHQCIHGASCRRGVSTSGNSATSCAVGRRSYTLDLLCGSVLGLLSVLEMTMQQASRPRLLLTASPMSSQQRRREDDVRVIRVELSNSGERLVGLRFPGELVDKADQLAREIIKRNKSMMKNVRPDPDFSVALASSAWLHEDASPVLPKFASRAFTSPPKITSFFKPTSSNSSTSLTSRQSVSGIKSEITPVTKPVLDKCESKKKKLNKRELCDAKSSCSKITRSASKVRKIDEKTPAISLTISPSLSQASKLPKKQSSLTDLFSKQKLKTVQCPICQYEFPCESSNGVINDHIDNCVID